MSRSSQLSSSSAPFTLISSSPPPLDSVGFRPPPLLSLPFPLPVLLLEDIKPPPLYPSHRARTSMTLRTRQHLRRALDSASSDVNQHRLFIVHRVSFLCRDTGAPSPPSSPSRRSMLIAECFRHLGIPRHTAPIFHSSSFSLKRLGVRLKSQVQTLPGRLYVEARSLEVPSLLSFDTSFGFPPSFTLVAHRALYTHVVLLRSFGTVIGNSSGETVFAANY
ncbi:hypothetical protein C8R47DRAFT_1230168 [Mycena vitilis]|nr:hypothetical protein C8R47DRAFT_1230168 [Mycena vitilis]